MELVVIIFAFGFLAMGTIWTLIGFHGHAIDDHPLCKKCGFDLFGKPAGHHRCSECGAQLRLPDSIVIGHREKRWGMLKLGLSLLICGLFLLSLFVVAAVNNIDIEHYTPTGFLLWEASHTTASKGSAALKELDRRLMAGLLTKDQIDSICDRGIAIQGDLSKAWNPDWGSFIEDANSANLVDKDRWTKYVGQAPQIKLHVRRKVTFGDNLPFSVEMTGRRGAGGSVNGCLWVQYYPLSLSSATFSKTIQFRGFSSISNGGGSQSGDIDAKDLISIPLGVNPLRLSLINSVTLGHPLRSPVICQLTTNLSTTLEVLPSGEKSVRFKHDPNLRDAVIKSLTGTSPWPYRTYDFSRSTNRLTFQLTGFDAPVGLAYRVTAQKGTRKWNLGTAAFAKGTIMTQQLSADSPDFAHHPDPLDIVLTPDLDVAANTIDIDEIWDEEVILKNIDIGWPGKPIH